MLHLKDWDQRYREKGLAVIGVHSPEFDEERNLETLRSQIASLGIRYPVVSDNDYQTWNAYKVEAWPTVFLLDKQGRIRWMRVGEGDYDEAERQIQKVREKNQTEQTFRKAATRIDGLSEYPEECSVPLELTHRPANVPQ